MAPRGASAPGAESAGGRQCCGRALAPEAEASVSSARGGEKPQASPGPPLLLPSARLEVHGSSPPPKKLSVAAISSAVVDRGGTG